MSILRLNHFKALPGQFEALVAAFERLVPQIETITGCERCELLLNNSAANPDEDGTLVVLEVWTSIEAHKASVRAIDPKAIAAIMPMLDGPPSGQYYRAVESD